MAPLPRPAAYAIAVAFAAAALLVRGAVDHWLGPLQPFASGFVAVAAAAWFLGPRPAVLTTLLCYAGAAYFFVAPRGSLGPSSAAEVAATITFFAAAGAIVLIGHRARVAERQLARANAELRESDQRKDAFLATLSHELRNPLGVLTNAVTLLQRQEPDPRVQPTLAVLARQIAHMQRLVEDLLDVGRISRGRLLLRREVMDVRAALLDAVEANRHAITERGQTIATTQPPDPVLADADQARLLQVFSNLVDNASKYSPAGATIHVSLARAPDIVLDVRDEGPGIDPALLPRVFDLFDQGVPSASSSGLGLGLGLCKRLIELHGGTIAAIPNEGGRGTTFRVTLPAR